MAKKPGPKPQNGPAEEEVKKPTPEQLAADRAEQELKAMEPADEAEQLARLLCMDNGERPDNFRMGAPRWHGYLPAARQHIAAFDFLMEKRNGQ